MVRTHPDKAKDVLTNSVAARMLLITELGAENYATRLETQEQHDILIDEGFVETEWASMEGSRQKNKADLPIDVKKMMKRRKTEKKVKGVYIRPIGYGICKFPNTNIVKVGDEYLFARSEAELMKWLSRELIRKSSGHADNIIDTHLGGDTKNIRIRPVVVKATPEFGTHQIEVKKTSPLYEAEEFSCIEEVFEGTAKLYAWEA